MAGQINNSRYAEKFHLTAELVDAGIAIKRANLKRRLPKASETEIDQLLSEWLRGRPADSPGRVRKLA